MKNEGRCKAEGLRPTESEEREIRIICLASCKGFGLEKRNEEGRERDLHCWADRQMKRYTDRIKRKVDVMFLFYTIAQEGVQFTEVTKKVV